MLRKEPCLRQAAIVKHRIGTDLNLNPQDKQPRLGDAVGVNRTAKLYFIATTSSRSEQLATMASSTSTKPRMST